MANNVGNISIGLSLDNQSFAAKLDSETSRVAKFTGTLQQSSASFSASASGVNRFTASVSGLARPMQQAAFGLGEPVNIGERFDDLRFGELFDQLDAESFDIHRRP